MAETSARTLRDLLSERGHIGEPEFYGLFLDVASDLDTAHTQASLHGDIKPEKIVKTRAGKYGLVDYGISRLGTARYMSPERARRIATDVRSDIYSLGVVMYEAAAGRPPFEGMNYQVIQAHLNDAPLLPKSVRSDISAGLQRVVLTAMAKDPADRYQSARALADALRELSAEYADAVQGRSGQGAPTAARPSSEGPALTPVKTPAGTMSGRRPPPPPDGVRQSGGRGQARKPVPPAKDKVKVSEPAPAAAPVEPRREESRAISSGPAAPSLSARPVSAPPRSPVHRPVAPPGRPKPVLLAAGAGGVVLVFVVLLLLLCGRGPKVPDAFGLTASQAVGLAGRVGLVVAVAESRDDTLPAGRVIGQRPVPGARAGDADTLYLFLSTGQVEVPDVLSLPAEDARERLARFGLLVVAFDSGYSDQQVAGAILATEPRPGSRTAVGSDVRLTVAAGRATCPDCGTRRAQGARFCTNCGYRFEL